MRIEKIRKMINDAIADEGKTGRVAAVVRQVARNNGATPSDHDVQGVVEFVRGYVEHVPLFLEQGIAAAGGSGLSAEINQMLGELERYWFEANDIAPDHLGLLGIMDDAYASLVLLQLMSDYSQGSSGKSLVQPNLTAANQAMHQLIGEPHATQIDQMVGVTIGQALMQRMVMNAAAGGFAFGGSAPDPIWGNTPIDQQVDTQLGAMGIF